MRSRRGDEIGDPQYTSAMRIPDTKLAGELHEQVEG
jgi:hypothetical protein